MAMLCLNDIKPGQCGMVEKIISEPEMKRRLIDIGLVKNTKVMCVGKSPAGDPKAFLIRGAVIAIRSNDCKNILLNEAFGKRGE